MRMVDLVQGKVTPEFQPCASGMLGASLHECVCVAHQHQLPDVGGCASPRAKGRFDSSTSVVPVSTSVLPRLSKELRFMYLPPPLLLRPKLPLHLPLHLGELCDG
jgi:hypothetical protein